MDVPLYMYCICVHFDFFCRSSRVTIIHLMAVKIEELRYNLLYTVHDVTVSVSIQ